MSKFFVILSICLVFALGTVATLEACDKSLFGWPSEEVAVVMSPHAVQEVMTPQGPAYVVVIPAGTFSLEMKNKYWFTGSDLGIEEETTENLDPKMKKLPF